MKGPDSNPTAYVAPAELAWVVADRALRAARQADEPSAIAAAAWTLADDIDPDVMPSTERRSRLWVEVARGHLQRGDRTAALHLMKMAHGISLETVVYTPSARSVAAELWRKAPRAMRGEAGKLAEQVGVMTG